MNQAVSDESDDFPENASPVQLAQSPERTQVATIAWIEVQSIG